MFNGIFFVATVLCFLEDGHAPSLLVGGVLSTEIPRVISNKKRAFKSNDLKALVNSRREDRIRTCDPVVPNHVFYRAELPPERLFSFNLTNQSLRSNRVAKVKTFHFPSKLKRVTALYFL